MVQLVVAAPAPLAVVPVENPSDPVVAGNSLVSVFCQHYELVDWCVSQTDDSSLGISHPKVF